MTSQILYANNSTNSNSSNMSVNYEEQKVKSKKDSKRKSDPNSKLPC